MTDDPGRALIARLEEALEELSREAEAATEMDPLQEIGFFLTRDGPKVDVVASYLSGHGPESAHVLEDRVSFVLSHDAVTELRFERQLSVVEEIPRIALEGKELEALVARIATFLRGALPPGPIDFSNLVE